MSHVFNHVSCTRDENAAPKSDKHHNKNKGTTVETTLLLLLLGGKLAWEPHQDTATNLFEVQCTKKGHIGKSVCSTLHSIQIVSSKERCA